MSADQHPLWTPEEFEAELAEMVAEEAPRLFAVVHGYGDRVDAAISGWGLSFDDHADLIQLGGDVHLGMRSAERALRWNPAGGRGTARLVWVDQLPGKITD